MQGRAWALGVLAAMGTWGPDVHAYFIGTAVTPDCHEQITIEAFVEVVDDLDLSAIEVPDDDASRHLTDYVTERYALHHLDAVARYVAMTLFIGVRDLDNGGGSAMNVEELRLAHGRMDHQHPHCTRNHGDDGPAGDQAALSGSRTHLVGSLETSIEYARRAPARQNRWLPVVLDFYGDVTLPVWAPGFYLGRALHTLQDGFSHTLRTADFRQVIHVMNYTDAIDAVDAYDEPRDGMRHSVAMDYCDEENAEIVDAARRATAEIMLAAGQGWQTDHAGGVDSSVDGWWSYQPGCTAPDYCDSLWVEYARSDMSHPLVSCDVAPDPHRRAWLWAGLGFVLCSSRLRARRR